MQDDDDSAEGVGYRKPPRKTQFVKGRSGNPKGRPKGSKNLDAVLRKAAKETVTVTENGRRKTITKLEASFIQLANKAASGEPRSIQLLHQMIATSEARDTDPQRPRELDEADHRVLAGFIDRLRAAAEGERDED